MLTTNELWKKCKSGKRITYKDLGLCLNEKVSTCFAIIYCGEKTFYWDGLNYFDRNGNLASTKDKKRYSLS